jgi:hypothetical protein
MLGMKTLRAKVVNGRLVLNEPTKLAEGMELNLALADDEDDLDEKERAALDAAIAEGWASLRGGDRVSAEDVLDELERGE